MIYRELGKTGLKVSVVGFGGIPIQRISGEEAAKIIMRAGELGINFIDTAKGYTVSEEYIGKALKGVRKDWILATKSMARTADAMRKDIEDSLLKLKTDYIELYQVHNISDMDSYNKVIAKGGAYEALQKAKAEGLIGHIGVTAHSLDALKAALESRLFSSVMYPYNIVENQGEELFKRAHELNTGVIVMKPMAGGALRDGSLALKYILQNESVTTVIPGMDSIEQVEQNAACVNGAVKLSDEELKKCEEIRKKLGETFCRRCGYCGPCPEGINIPMLFLLKSYYDNYDLKDWAMERYEPLTKHARDCKSCGLCETRCPYKLPIREMIKATEKSLGY